MSYFPSYFTFFLIYVLHLEAFGGNLEKAARILIPVILQTLLTFSFNITTICLKQNPVLSIPYGFTKAAITNLEKMAVTSESCKYWKEKSLDTLRNFSSEGKKSICTELSSNLLRKKDSLEKNLNLQMDEIKRIEKELHDIESDKNIDFIKYKLDLYQLITNLTWDLDSVPTDVRGCVSKPFNAFSMSTDKYSKYHIVDYLWKLISGEVQPFTSSS